MSVEGLGGRLCLSPIAGDWADGSTFAADLGDVMPLQARVARRGHLQARGEVHPKSQVTMAPPRFLNAADDASMWTSPLPAVIH